MKHNLPVWPEILFAALYTSLVLAVGIWIGHSIFNRFEEGMYAGEEIQSSYAHFKLCHMGMVPIAGKPGWNSFEEVCPPDMPDTLHQYSE